MRPRDIPTPRSGAGWAWLAAGLLATWMLVLNGGNTRAEFSQGFGQGYADTCAPFFAAEPGQPPARLSPACDADGAYYAESPQPSREVAGAQANS